VAGAASSLIFLITFAVAHWITVLVRQRSGPRPPPFRSPWYPTVPVVGGVACLALAVHQGFASPLAGRITSIWLCLGGLLFLVLFAHRARVADASGAALDPELIKLRGRNPLVLVPIANPENVRALADVAKALAPPEVGRVLMLSVVVAPPGWRPRQEPRPLDAAQAVLREAIAANVESGVAPEALATVAGQPWAEIARVAGEHRCESLLLGLSQLAEETSGLPLETLLNRTDCDIVVLRAAAGWQLSQVKRILVPIGGRGGHDQLLARLLGSLSRNGQPEVSFLKVLPPQATAKERQLDEQAIGRIAHLLWPRACQVDVVCRADAISVVADYASRSDLVIMGVQRVSRRRKLFGQFALQVALRTTQPLLLVSRRG
jgi:nucleotide-binding universal stress UspA family protein